MESKSVRVKGSSWVTDLGLTGKGGLRSWDVNKTGV
jgi:hypothetical protein